MLLRLKNTFLLASPPLFRQPRACFPELGLQKEPHQKEHNRGGWARQFAVYGACANPLLRPHMVNWVMQLRQVDGPKEPQRMRTWVHTQEAAEGSAQGAGTTDY